MSITHKMKELVHYVIPWALVALNVLCLLNNGGIDDYWVKCSRSRSKWPKIQSENVGFERMEAYLIMWPLWAEHSGTQEKGY